MARNFTDLLQRRWSDGLHACVGLDGDYRKIPDAFKDGSVTQAIHAFNAKIVRETMHVAAAFKPNFGFYFAKGIPGLVALQDTIRFINDAAPDVPVILDMKIGDIGNTNDQYALGLLDEFRADAVTLSPYVGVGELEAFSKLKDKGVFILCRTSNPNAARIQNLPVANVSNMALYEVVAEEIATANKSGNVGLVAGATNPKELAVVRRIVGDDVPFLIPGVGAQGGEVQATVEAGRNSRGDGLLVNASRTIIYADDPGAAAEALHDEISHYLLTPA